MVTTSWPAAATTSAISPAPMTSTRDGPWRSAMKAPMISSGVRTCSATDTPSRCRRARRSAPVARELLDRNATRRPWRTRAARVSPAPGFSASPFQTQPSGSKTNASRPASTRSGRVFGALELLDRLGVGLLGALGDGGPAELLLDAPAPLLAHVTPQLGVLDEPAERLGEHVGPGGGHEEARDAVLDHLEDAAHRRRHHGRA